MKRPSLIAAVLSFFLMFAGMDATAGGFSGNALEEQDDTLRTSLEGMSAIYRAKLAKQYPMRYNGTPYWDTCGFKKGTVIFNGRLYEDMLVNLDAAQGEVSVKFSDQLAAVSPDRSQVPFFTRDGQAFINLRYLGVSGSKEGFYQILYDGKAAVLKRIDKVFASSPGDHYNMIGYKDPHYKPGVINYFDYSQSYWYLSDGKLSRIRGKGGLLSHYRDRKKEMKKVAAADLDEWYAKAMAVAEGVSVPERKLQKEASVWHPTVASAIHADFPQVYAPKMNPPVKEDLPAGFFSKTDTRSGSAELEGESVEVLYQNKVYTVGDPASTGNTKVVLSGIVRDVITGEPIPEVAVWDDKTNTYTRTDGEGRYSLTLPRGENVVNFSELTKQELNLRVVIYSAGGLDVSLGEGATRLNSAVISAESRKNHRSAAMGVETIGVKTLGKIPTAFGEGDVLKATLTLPGVKTVGEASGGFNVRGGSSDQNLILFNEGTIYNPSHMFGIFSAFNPGIVEGLELYKSSIPVEYGGRISSVMEIRSKEGSQEKVKGSLGLGLLTSRFHLEGPLGGKTTFVIGGRTTYSDWLLKSLKNSEYRDGKASFNDINLSLTHRVDSVNTVQLFAYRSGDKFSFNRDTTFRYRSTNAALRWRHRVGDGLSWTASAGVDRYDNRLEDFPNYTEAYSLETAINQAFLRLKFEKRAGGHTVTFGAEAVAYALEGGHLRPFSDSSLVISRDLETERAIQPSVYVGDSWKVDEKLSFDYGVRVSSFFARDPSKAYVGPEFRLSGKYSFTPDFSAKAGFNTLRQYIHLISNTTTISPMDTWKLCDASIKPVDGWQAAAGLYRTLMDGQLDLSVEGYWKSTRNSLDYKSGATLVMNENLAGDLVPTKGKAYGVEFMARKSVGKLTGWVSYTYSRTLLKEMEDRGISTINRGEWYRAAYDKPHDFKLAGNYALTARYSISCNIDYSTGRPVTVPVGYFRYAGGYRLAFSERNGYRIPDYFRLDLAFNIDPGHYLKQLTHMSLTFGCYNVTGRKNPYSVFYTTNGGTNLNGYMVSVFARPIPYVNLNILF